MVPFHPVNLLKLHSFSIFLANNLDIIPCISIYYSLMQMTTFRTFIVVLESQDIPVTVFFTILIHLLLYLPFPGFFIPSYIFIFLLGIIFLLSANNFLTFCLSENIFISYSCVRDIFIGYEILDGYLFSLYLSCLMFIELSEYLDWCLSSVLENSSPLSLWTTALASLFILLTPQLHIQKMSEQVSIPHVSLMFFRFSFALVSFLFFSLFSSTLVWAFSVLQFPTSAFFVPNFLLSNPSIGVLTYCISFLLKWPFDSLLEIQIFWQNSSALFILPFHSLLQIWIIGILMSSPDSFTIWDWV